MGGGKLPASLVAATVHDQQQERRADQRHQDGAHTSEAIGKEGEHKRMRMSVSGGGWWRDQYDRRACPCRVHLSDRPTFPESREMTENN
jgi:hypothetical protein